MTIYEVGPRDGLQNESAMVPIEVKAELVRRLARRRACPIVEATSFVHPTWVPQLADAEELMRMLGDEGRDLPVLVPNERGPRPGAGARAAGTSRSSAARPRPSRRRTSTASLDEQFAMFEPVVRRARDAGLDVRAYVSMCFGDPWEGAVPIEQVVAVGAPAARPRRLAS